MDKMELHRLAQSIRATGKVKAGAEKVHGGFMGWAQYGSSCDKIADGFSEDKRVAIDLATIEAVELYCLEQYGRDGWAEDKQSLRAKGVSYLDFNALVPLTAEQLKRAGLRRPSDDEPIDWCIGKNSMGQQIRIPSELVYYSGSMAEFYRTNSAGTAVRAELEEAIIAGLEELIEKDALMRTWITHSSPKKIEGNCLSEWVRKVKKTLKSENRVLIMLDLTDISTKDVAVFLAIITSSKFPFFVTGSAASFSSPIVAMEKAASEAIHNLNGWTEMGQKFWKWEKDSRDYHGLYYAGKKRLGLGWLFSGRESKGLWPIYAFSAEEALERYDGIYVDISDITFPTAKVVKVFSPLLVPISFGGADMLHYKKLQKCSPLSLLRPHCFA